MRQTRNKKGARWNDLAEIYLSVDGLLFRPRDVSVLEVLLM